MKVKIKGGLVSYKGKVYRSGEVIDVDAGFKARLEKAGQITVLKNAKTKKVQPVPERGPEQDVL